MHMTVPKKFRKRAVMPKVLVLHFEDLPKEDIRFQQGYMVTSPLRTLIDIRLLSKLHSRSIKNRQKRPK